MGRYTLKDRLGRTLGFREDKGNLIAGLNSRGQYRGRYDRQFDTTYSQYGQYIGAGDLLSSLIFDDEGD
ncbi:MAG: hypothetical protein IVW54_08415 [Candidatus Binataceae bacterium]|nr:hypothetical protein [Candidatus Binataceae bacterium]